tara:strand:- start:133 stop:1143 length:1011 start_codon:yes stop_codon:yes gene_type:complete
MGQMGRYGDNTMAHVSTGEMIVPQEVLDKRPDLKTGIMAALSQEGLNPDRYTVGSGINSINPATGQPEFFNLKKLLRFAAPFLLGPAIGSLLGTASTGILGGLGKIKGLSGVANVLSNPIAKGALGAAATGALTGQKGRDLARSALLGGLGGLTFQSGKTDKIKGLFTGEGSRNFADTPVKTVLGEGIKAVLPADSAFFTSPVFKALDTQLGQLAAIGLTAQAFDALSPEEKQEAIEQIERKFGFGSFNPLTDFGAFFEKQKRLKEMKDGGIADFPRRTGGIDPSEGSGTKDDVPAMLMAGEFVLTRDAVKGLGDGDLDKGINRAYSMMDKLERKA